MSVENEKTHHQPESEGTAKGVADAFLNQYYEVLGSHPELVHKFYVESSVISRPAADGSVSSVTTLKGIDELIQSLYAEGESYVDIGTAEAQFSYGDGLVILVNGLIGSEELKKSFSQMFFLAPQERGYYVLNDMFQYNGKEVSASIVVENKLGSAVAEESELKAVKVRAENGKKETESAVVDRGIAIEAKTSPNDKNVAMNSAKANGQSNGKLSYASVIKAPASSTPASQTTPVASKPVLNAPQISSPVSVAPSLSSNVVKEPSNDVPVSQSNDKKLSLPNKENGQKDDDRSISVWELPLSIKPFQLDRSFSKNFGPVKQRGIQIRNVQGKNGPICYAFIEFESASSAEAAIKASTVSIDGRPVVVKRKTNKGKNTSKSRTGSSPQRDDKSRGHGRLRDASQDSNNAGQRNENGKTHSKSNGHISYEHDKAGTPAAPAKPEIDEDGFQTVSRNGKWKTQRN